MSASAELRLFPALIMALLGIALGGCSISPYAARRLHDFKDTYTATVGKGGGDKS